MSWKLAAIRPLTGSVLDCTTGLGYTAILAGRTASHVTTIERGQLAQGVYARTWNMAGAASDVYFVRLKANGATLTRTIVRVR